MIEGIPDWFTIPALILGVLIGLALINAARHSFRSPRPRHHRR